MKENTLKENTLKENTLKENTLKENTFNIKITLCEEESNVKKNQKKEKTFTQNIADIISDYEQALVNWDAKLISDAEMEEKITNFQLKARDMMIDMLDEFKTINNILGYLRTMISATRIASIYGEEVSDDLKDIIDKIDFIRDKIKFNKKEPVIGRSVGVDKIEKLLSEEEEIEILDLEENETKKECSNCQGYNCKNNDLKEIIELIDLLKKFLYKYRN